MTTISAKSILSSRHALDENIRGDTLLLRYPRCIHAEMQTHRIISLDEDFEISLATPSLMADENLSRNASSSRAIPVEKLIADVERDPFIPLYWGKNQPGMQATEELSGVERNNAELEWRLALNNALASAKRLAKIGAHKQIINRILEPFAHITVLVTATNWSNFLVLRDHSDAEPHIQILACEIRKAIDGAEVRDRYPGEWHLPFISPDEYGSCTVEQLKMLSVARCASTSYKTVDGFDMTLERAEKIWEKLHAQPLHASPFEHVFQMDHRPLGVWEHSHLGGNLGPGVIQLRKTIPGEMAR